MVAPMYATTIIASTATPIAISGPEVGVVRRSSSFTSFRAIVSIDSARQ